MVGLGGVEQCLGTDRLLIPVYLRKTTNMLTLLSLLVLPAIFQAPLREQSPILSAKSFHPIKSRFQALGNGVADDTEPLQEAIDTAIQNHTALELEPGTYRITKTLVIDTPRSEMPSGFILRGMTGPNRNVKNSGNGVGIMLDDPSHINRSILRIGHAPFREITIENIGFGCTTPDNKTPYGIEFDGSRFSHTMLRNLLVAQVDTAFSITPVSAPEGNGEQVDIYDSIAEYVNCFYENHNGQAYNHHIVNCNTTIKNGGTAFKIGTGNLGFSLDVFGFTSSFGSGPAQNTFLRNDGVSGILNFYGGRQEDIDTVLAYNGGSRDQTGIVQFNGMTFTDMKPTFPIIDATPKNFGNAQYTNSFLACQFIYRRKADGRAWMAAQQGDLSENIFDKCVFQFTRMDFDKTAPAKFEDCRVHSSTDMKLTPVNQNH